MKRYKTRVTIIIGIICKNGIIVASDSQTSWGNSKRTDTDKIHSCRFKNSKGIIANSGHAAISYKAVDIAKSICESQELVESRQFAENAQKAAEKVRADLMEPYRSFGSKPEDFEKLFNDHNYSLLMANYFDGKPYIYTLDFPPGISTKQKNYTAIGCGSNLGMFLLSWFDFSQMDTADAAITAAFIIGEVKKADAFCGGPTQIAWLNEKNVMKRFNREQIDIFEQEIESGTSQYKKDWAKSIEVIGERIVERLNSLKA